jgi:hypothetical protein
MGLAILMFRTRLGLSRAEAEERIDGLPILRVAEPEGLEISLVRVGFFFDPIILIIEDFGDLGFIGFFFMVVYILLVFTALNLGNMIMNFLLLPSKTRKALFPALIRSLGRYTY